jgi:hypothetical protein
LTSAGADLDERIGSFIAGTGIVGAAKPVDENNCCVGKDGVPSQVRAAVDIGAVEEV